MIIWIDIPLMLTGLFFFLLSWCYGWGLLHFFRYRFRWSLAAIVGIASVVSVTYMFVWQTRGIGEPLQAVWDLAVIFLCATPGMTWVDYQLMRDEEIDKRTKKKEDKIEKVTRVREQVLEN